MRIALSIVGLCLCVALFPPLGLLAAVAFAIAYAIKRSRKAASPARAWGQYWSTRPAAKRSVTKLLG